MIQALRRLHCRLWGHTPPDEPVWWTDGYNTPERPPAGTCTVCGEDLM